MMKFNDIKYSRPNYDEISARINLLIEDLRGAQDYEKYLETFKEIISIQNHIEEMYDYADIRNMRDATDEFFSAEITYWNEYKPKFDLLFKPFYELCCASKFREQLNEIVPENFFNTIDFQVKITSDEIVELQKRENQLKSEYRTIMREKIMYEGEERNLSFISGYFNDKDRDIRKKSHDAVNDFYYEKQSELDQILYNLVNTRNEIAHKMGFDNYSTYSLYKLRRFGYDYSKIASFRNNIIKYIVPLCNKLSEWKKQELGLDEITYYDTIYFKEMPSLLCSGKELLIKFGESLKKINFELYSFYNEMLENGYIDLETRNNKVNFGITNYLTESGVPVITGNFKNSYVDIQVASHEFGHAYQKYNASIKDKEYVISSLLKYPTFDIAEMFSYAMELICLNYIDDLFTEEDYKKYCFMKHYNLVSTIPYICLVDEFQEQLYSKENLKVEDIRDLWLELSKKYKFDNNNKGHVNLESGGYFYRQTHIFSDPFYYIDYALSYFGAFAISDACKDNLEMFENIGAVASYYPFQKLIEEYNMTNPFEERSVKEVANMLEHKLLKYKIN